MRCCAYEGIRRTLERSDQIDGIGLFDGRLAGQIMVAMWKRSSVTCARPRQQMLTLSFLPCCQRDIFDPLSAGRVAGGNYPLPPLDLESTPFKVGQFKAAGNIPLIRPRVRSGEV